MGQKMNPNAIRIAANNQYKNGIFPGGFVNLWFSDYKYFTFFYKDFVIKKSKIFIMKYYKKKKVRFLKGRRRRLKSVLRLSRLSCLHFPYKKQLVCFLLGHNSMGLQRKHTAFTYHFRKKTPTRLFLNNQNTYPLNRKIDNTLSFLNILVDRKRSSKQSENQQKNVYLKRIKKLAGGASLIKKLFYCF